MAALEELDDLVGRHVGAVVLGLSGRGTQVRDADELGVVLHELVGEVADVLALVAVRGRGRVRVRVRVRVRLRVRVRP